MFVADYTGHNILKYSDNQLHVFAHNSSMNQPNDIAIMGQGLDLIYKFLKNAAELLFINKCLGRNRWESHFL